MNSMIVNCLRGLLLGTVLFAIHGCYYMQAARGQLEIVRKREPIAEVLRTRDAELGYASAPRGGGAAVFDR